MLFIGWSKFLSRHYQSEALNRCGIHTSSVGNFCARSSDVIRGETSGGSTKCRLFSSGYDWSNGGQKLIFFKIWEKKIVTVTFGRQIFCIWNFEVAKTTVRCCGCKIPVIQKVVFFLIHRPRRQTRRRRYSTSCYGASSSLLLEASYRNHLKWSTTHWVSRYLGRSLPSILSAGNRSVMWGDSVTVLTCVHHDSVRVPLQSLMRPLKVLLPSWERSFENMKSNGCRDKMGLLSYK